MTQVLERCAGYQRLRAQYADRLGAARAAAAAGQRVIGRIGHTTPVEHILAAGCTPVTLAADLQRATPRADLHVDPELPAETRALCEAALAGDYECLQLLILTRLHDKLYYFLKELHQIGRAPHMPPFTIHDLMHSRRDAVQAYNRDRFQALLKRLGREAVRPIDHASLTEAIGLTNSVRGLWRRLDAMRQEGRIRGTQAMQVIGAGLVMHPAAYAPRVAVLRRHARIGAAGTGAFCRARCPSVVRALAAPGAARCRGVRGGLRGVRGRPLGRTRWRR